MKIIMRFDWDDEKLRKVRAALGYRGGKASRKDCRIFIDRTIYDRLKIIEAPRPSRPKVNPHAEAERIVNEVLTTVCTCGATYNEHRAVRGVMLCPVSKKNPPRSGRAFEAVSNV